MCPLVMTSMFNRNNDIYKYMTHLAKLLQAPILKTMYKITRLRNVQL